MSSFLDFFHSGSKKYEPERQIGQKGKEETNKKEEGSSIENSE